MAPLHPNLVLIQSNFTSHTSDRSFVPQICHTQFFNEKKIAFYGIAEEIIIFAKQYLFASCLPGVLLFRMNPPVFSARTQLPFTMPGGRKQVSPGPFILKELSPTGLAGHCLMTCSGRPLTTCYFTGECFSVASLQPQDTKPSRVRQWFCLIPWQFCHFWLGSDTAFVFSRAINCSSLSFGCK